MSYQYTYLLMGAVFFVFWLALFIWRKDTRKEMLIISLISAVGGPVLDIIYTLDWWHPLTITGTQIGIEAAIVGFMIGGIAAVIYEDVFKKRLRIRKTTRSGETKRNLNLFWIVLSFFVILFVSFYLFKLNSLISTFLSMFIPTLFIWFKRRDLIIDSLATGVLLVVVASIVYSVLEFLTPGWIPAFWVFSNVPDKIIFGLPIDDIVWYFFLGLGAGPLYEYWQEGRLVDA